MVEKIRARQFLSFSRIFLSFLILFFVSNVILQAVISVSSISSTNFAIPYLKLIIEKKAAVPCTEPGRFLNVNQTDGRSYWFCYLDENGKLAWMNLMCPNGRIFDSATKACILNKNTTTTTTTITITTTTTTTTTTTKNEPTTVVTTTTTTTTTTSSTEAPCTEPGRFLNVNQTDGRSYWFCYLDENGKLAWMKMTCPNGRVFDSAIKTCILNTTTSTTEATNGVTSTTMRPTPTTLARPTFRKALTPPMSRETSTKLITGTTTPTPPVDPPPLFATPVPTQPTIFSRQMPVMPIPAPPTVSR